MTLITIVLVLLLNNQGSQHPVENCNVSILAPKAEESVGSQGDVIMRTKIPDQGFIWVLARRDDQPRSFYWPQAGYSARQVNNAEEVSFPVHYGVPGDENHLFKVVTVVVDSATNARLEKWREQAPSRGYAPWVGLPTSLEGCRPSELIVPNLLAGGFDRITEQVQQSRTSDVIVTGLMDGAVSAGRGFGRPSMEPAGPTPLFGDFKSGKGQRGAGSGDDRARLLSAPVPVYTDEAKRAHISGEVVLRVQLLAGGSVRVLTVLSRLGFGLDEAAIDAVNQARCSPAKRAGLPVDTIGTVRVKFKLA